MAKKKSSQWKKRKDTPIWESVYRHVVCPVDIPIPSMQEVKEFLAAVNPTNGLVSITHKLVEDGTVSEQYYQIALAGGMTHFNQKTGNFALVAKGG